MSILRPAHAIPPGSLIARELDARGWTQEDLARSTGRPELEIAEIVSGASRVTPEIAQELAAAFGTSQALWLNLETFSHRAPSDR